MIEDEENLQAVMEDGERRSWALRMTVWVAVLRILQLAIGFTTLVLTGYVVHVFGGDYFHSFSMTFFTFIWTLLFMGYIFITRDYIPKCYFYWLHIASEIFTLLFWLTSFSLLIWECQTWDTAQDAIVTTLSGEEVAAINSLPNQGPAIVSLRVATAMACVNWILFGTTLCICTRYTTSR
ncbi:hypothetical protein B0J14DRAFT_330961 [Halenospora varia]|nr:hypothetical protein B0J14DRAFT_330961 [Halenospora varia]